MTDETFAQANVLKEKLDKARADVAYLSRAAHEWAETKEIAKARPGYTVRRCILRLYKKEKKDPPTLQFAQYENRYLDFDEDTMRLILEHYRKKLDLLERQFAEMAE